MIYRIWLQKLHLHQHQPNTIEYYFENNKFHWHVCFDQMELSIGGNPDPYSVVAPFDKEEV